MASGLGTLESEVYWRCSAETNLTRHKVLVLLPTSGSKWQKPLVVIRQVKDIDYEVEIQTGRTVGWVTVLIALY